MKNIFKIYLTLSIFLSLTSFAYPIDCLLNPSKKQAISIVKKYDKALKKKDINKALSFYDKDFKSADGFSIDDVKILINKTYEAFPNLKYKTKINDVSIEDNIVMIKISDITKAKIYPEIDKNVNKKLAKKIKKEKAGNLLGKSDYIMYLKKTNGYKIISDKTLMEETSLKYGLANKIDMKLTTPEFLKKGELYDISLDINKPDDITAMAAINREEIKFPNVDYPEKYRKFPDYGPLERLVKANNENYDEYATASIGLTKVSINENQTKARIEIVGMAYLMKRVNMEPASIAANQDKEGKNDETKKL